MSANQTVDPEEIAELIGRCKLAMSVSEFHGALVGYISAGGRNRMVTAQNLNLFFYIPEPLAVG